MHPEGKTWFLHDDAATWGHFRNQPKNVQPNIWVSTKQFRFDYSLDGDRLTELDKMGVQGVLTKREKMNQPAK